MKEVVLIKNNERFQQDGTFNLIKNGRYRLATDFTEDNVTKQDSFCSMVYFLEEILNQSWARSYYGGDNYICFQIYQLKALIIAQLKEPNEHPLIKKDLKTLYELMGDSPFKGRKESRITVNKRIAA